MNETFLVYQNHMETYNTQGQNQKQMQSDAASILLHCYKFEFHYLKNIEEQHLKLHVQDFQNKIFGISPLKIGIH